MSREVESSIAICYVGSALRHKQVRDSYSTRNDKLLQPFAVNLVNAHKASDEIPILLIRESSSVWRPAKLSRRFWMIWIVNQIALDSWIRGKTILFIN